MRTLFERIGERSCAGTSGDCFETRAAVAFEALVSRQVVSTHDQRPDSRQSRSVAGHYLRGKDRESLLFRPIPEGGDLDPATSVSSRRDVRTRAARWCSCSRACCRFRLRIGTRCCLPPPALVLDTQCNITGRNAGGARRIFEIFYGAHRTPSP